MAASNDSASGMDMDPETGPAITLDTGGGNEAGDEKEAEIETSTPSPTFNKIRMLQERLFELERENELTHQEKALAQHQRAWDSQLKALGSEKVKEYWEKVRDSRARSFINDTTAFALSQEYTSRQQGSFAHRLMEQEAFDQQLMRLRERWEVAQGITDPSPGEVSQQSTLPVVRLQDIFKNSPRYWNTEEAKFDDSGRATTYNMREERLRAALRENQYEKHEAFQLWKSHQEKAASSDPPLPDPGPSWVKTAVNVVKWLFFKYEAGRQDKFEDEFVIDVLDGEPDSTVTEAHYKVLKREIVTKKREGKEEAPQSVTPRITRALPVPERIRLNGRQLQETISFLLPKERKFKSSPAMVILQPFRILMSQPYETGLKCQYDILKERYNTHSGQKDGMEGTEEQSTPQDQLHDDSRPGTNDVGFEGVNSSDMASKDEGHKPDDEHKDLQPDDDAKSQQSTSTDEAEGEDIFLNSPQTMEQLGCLIDFMDTYLLPRKEYLRGPECRKVHFRDLWYLFQPGDEVIRRDGKQVYRVIGTFNPMHKASSRSFYIGFDDDSKSNRFELECVYVDFDGKKLGPVRKTFLIRSFVGEKPVESLEVYPLKLHRNSTKSFKQNEKDQASADWQAIRQSFVKRGQKFFQAACMKLENTFYNGPTEKGDAVESQIVIDFEMAFSSEDNIGKDRSPEIESLIPGEADDASQASNDWLMCYGHCCAGEDVLDDSWVDDQRSEEYIESLLPKSYSDQPSVVIYPRSLADVTGENALADDEYVLMTYRVFAFVLRTRQWAELDLTYIEGENDSDIGADQEYPKTAFDHLMLPPGHKEIVKSLISQHYRNRDSGRGTIEHSDIVRGKGNGLILLLHGAPGVGKTSTAEGVAELFKKPLFTITCGDLGSTAKEVEKALDLNFNLANRWGCILLLDEADVFLTSRTETDFERNGLVAVFLRVLEYYAGILFLTTNRVGVIDEAFRSRIHVSLHYPALNREQTEAVFQLNLKLIQNRFDKDKRRIKIESIDIVASALEYFDHNPKVRWNGRQIRNACQTALALAEFKAQGNSHRKILDPDAEVHLEVENVQTVSKAYLDFTKYLKHLYGSWEGERAKELGHRAREGGRQHVSEQRFGAWGTNSQPGGSAQSQLLSNVPLSNLTPAPGYSYPSAPAPGQPVYTVQQPGVAAYYGSNLTPTGLAGNFTNYGNPGQVTATSTHQLNPGFVVQSQQLQQPQQHQQPQPGQGNYPSQAQPWVGQANAANFGAPPASSSMTGHPPFQAHQPMQQYTGQQAGAVPMSSTPPVNPQFQGGFQQPTQQQQQQPMQQQPMQQQPTQQQPQQPEWPNFNIQALQSGEPGNQPGSSQ